MSHSAKIWCYSVWRREGLCLEESLQALGHELFRVLRHLGWQSALVRCDGGTKIEDYHVSSKRGIANHEAKDLLHATLRDLHENNSDTIKVVHLGIHQFPIACKSSPRQVWIATPNQPNVLSSEWISEFVHSFSRDFRASAGWPCCNGKQSPHYLLHNLSTWLPSLHALTDWLGRIPVRSKDLSGPRTCPLIVLNEAVQDSPIGLNCPFDFFC